jgi:hypothetical protein
MTMTDRQVGAWVGAMGSPSVMWAANDLGWMARELDEAAHRLARAEELAANAGADDLRTLADTAATAAWRLADGLAAVSSALTRSAEEVDQ